MKITCAVAVVLLLVTPELCLGSLTYKKNAVRHGLLSNRAREDPDDTSSKHNEPEPKAARIEPKDAEGGFTRVKWPSTSRIPKFAQWILVICWITMMGSLPFLIPLLDNNPVTLTQMYVGGSMLVVLFGGLYLFTQIILFQSVHFDDIRPLTFVECIYFMSQIITTVGYGDITPAKTRGQIFVAIYVVGALFIIAMLVGQIVDHMVAMFQSHQEEMWRDSPRSSRRGEGETPRTSPRSLSVRSAEDKHSFAHGSIHPGSAASGGVKMSALHDLLHPERPSVQPLMVACGLFVCIVVIWVIFFANYPGENKTAFQALYMSLITMSTVGFGAFTPLTEGGMIFNAYFMIIGSASIVNVIGKFCEFIALMTEFQRYSTTVKEKALNDLKSICRDKTKVTALEFFRFVMSYEGKITDDAFEETMRVFDDMGPHHGVLEFSKLEEAMEVDKGREHYFDSTPLENVVPKVDSKKIIDKAKSTANLER